MAGKEQPSIGVDQCQSPLYVQLNQEELFLKNPSLILTEKGMIVEGILQRYRVLESTPGDSQSLTISEQWANEIINGYKELGISRDGLPLYELRRQFSNIVEERIFRPNLPKKPEDS